MKWTTLKNLKRKDVLSSPLTPTLIVFVIMLCLIATTWRTAERDIDTTLTNLIEERVTLSEVGVRQQILSYENALLAGKGLIEGSEQVDRQEWKSFVDSLDIKTRRKGMLGLGYVEFIAPENVEQYESKVRNDGFPDFKIWPIKDDRELYSSITYIEPFDEVNMPALGYDMYTEPIRKAAMDRAIATGSPAMTSKIKLVQSKRESQIGLNLYQVLYRPGAVLNTPEQRKEAAIGFTYAPFLTEALFGSVFTESNSDYNVRVYDGNTPDPESLLYQHNKDTQDFMWIRKDKMDVSGVAWTFEFGIKESVIPQPIRQRPKSVLVGGALFSVILASVVYLLLQQRSRRLFEKEERRVQRAKDNMLSLASHQLRTPATGVKQYVGMVLEGFTGDLTHEQKQMLQNAYQSNERQLRIINEFLYLAKAEAERIVISPQRLDLAELVSQVRDEMSNEFLESGHSVNIHTHKKKTFIAGDVHCVRMVVENLISNAIKYTPNGGKVDIEIIKKNGEVLLSIQDNGVGIAERDFPKLFKQFSRISNQLTRETSGSGIGLYLAKLLAELNMAYISVLSEPEKGSTFTVHFTVTNVRNFTVSERLKD